MRNAEKNGAGERMKRNFFLFKDSRLKPSLDLFKTSEFKGIQQGEVCRAVVTNEWLL